MNKPVEVEAIFGSSPRGEADDLSDRDLLLIDDDVIALRERRERLTAEGWSAAAYTWKRLCTLIEKRALFIQHLKLECEIIQDRHGRFEAALRAFRPKGSYTAEIRSNADLASVAEQYPDTELGALWAADVIYVSLRNFGVLRLAEQQRYVFSYRAILENLVEAGSLRAHQLAPLLKLRWMKSLYRSGEAIPLDKAKAIVREAVGALPLNEVLVACCPVPPAGLISSLRPLGVGVQSYQRLRYLEKMYIALLALKPQVGTEPDFHRLKRWIEDPRSYAAIAAANEAELCRVIGRASERVGQPRKALCPPYMAAGASLPDVTWLSNYRWRVNAEWNARHADRRG